jgi:hypothetical protein
MTRAAITRIAMTRTVVLAGVLALGACVAADEPVLTAGPTLRTCDEVLMRTFDEQACEFDGVCTWTDAQDPNGTACCTYFAICTEGRLLVEPMCSMTVACDQCPDGTVPVRAVACGTTCTCAPPSECNGTDPMACDPSRVCYRGQVCTDDCAPGQLDCCANVCADAGCAEPAPLGCRMDCPMELGCATCMATACTCAAGVWQCTPVCSDAVGPCFLP